MPHRKPPLASVPLDERCAAARRVIFQNKNMTPEERFEILMLALCPPREDEDDDS